MEDRLSPEDLEYLSQFEESEGKQNDLMETDPPTSQNTETTNKRANASINTSLLIYDYNQKKDNNY